MNSYFDRLDLEMIALESAIGAYEAENGITDEYLHDYSEPAPAYESAANDDFGFGLFDDMYATPATEEAESGKSSKIGGGIKKILGAIKGFFIKCKDGVVAFFQSFKKKKAEVKSEDVKANASPEALKLAETMRGALKQAFKIVGDITTKDANYIASICQQIRDILDQVDRSTGMSDTLYRAHTNKEFHDIDSDVAQNAMSEVGKQFRQSGHFGSDESTQGAKAEKELNRAEEILKNVEATEKDLQAAIANVTTIFNKEYNAAMAKVKNRNNNTTETKYYDSNSTSFDVERDREEARDKARKEERARDEEVRKYNEEARKRQNVGGNERARGSADLDLAKLRQQTKQIIFVDYDLSAVQRAVDGVINACGNHADQCEKIAAKAPANVTGDAKIAYQMCKVLSRSSNVYTKISAAIQRLASGAIFDQSGDDGSNIVGAAFAPSVRDRARAGKSQRQFIDE